MFQKNLAAIRISNPDLADRLEKIDINSIEGIDVYKAESEDLIIAYKNTVLHSPIDPIREARTVWNRTVKAELAKNDIQLVFGLGLGYLFKRAYVSAQSKIFVFEPYIEVIRFVAEHVDLSNEFADKRVYISDNIKDIYEKLQNEFLSGDRVEFLFLDLVAQANQKLLEDLTVKVFEIIGSRANDENTIFALCKIWTENFVKSLKSFEEARPLGYLDGKFSDKTALIVSPGPSLADDIELIKSHQDKFVIVSVGRAFKILVDAGIIPDFTVFADARFFLEQVDGVEKYLEKTNVVLTSKCDNDAYSIKAKSKILYFSINDKMTKLFEKLGTKEIGFYKSGSSVSIISYYFAKALGFKQIAFSGLDLAILGSTLYAKGESVYNDDGSIIQNKVAWNKLVPTKDKDGNPLQTRSDYAWFIRQFSEIFTEEVNLARIINTSLKGAYIAGMEYMSFENFSKLLSEEKGAVDKVVSQTFAETKKEWAAVYSKVMEKMQDVKVELLNIQKDSAEIESVFAKICAEVEKTGITTYNQESFSVLGDKVTATRQKLFDNVLLSNSMQKEVWHFSKNYITKQLPSKEEVMKNFLMERDFFKAVKEESQIILGYLDSLPSLQNI
jgi:hypothetical protein